jgi:ATP-dependent helicase HrpB
MPATVRDLPHCFKPDACQAGPNRQESAMRPTLPHLPIDDVLPELCTALDAGTRAVLVAAPGAGKTTRVPLALLDAAWRRDGKIIVLEPRRLAARAAARFMAGLLGEPVGKTVGYRVRLESRISAETRVEVVTEGIFTRMVTEAPDLPGIAAVVFDEFHERSLDADLGLALALDATALREDLRLVVMSATIDGARVADLLGGVPVIVSEGRSFPIETRHTPLAAGQRIEDGVASAVFDALATETGSILVFVPGQAEIRRVSTLLADRLPANVTLHALHGQLQSDEQDAAIRPAANGTRKIVLATAIAETSLTIEGVRVVIDSGLARVPNFDPATGMTVLATRRVSRAAANQRRGRAGRVAPGVCVRLWHEGQTAALPPFDTPEILEADLTGLVLALARAGLIDPGVLAWLDPPPTPAWTEARALLESLGALDASGHLTPHGGALARFPLHPRLAHMIARAADVGAVDDACLLAALLSEPGLGGRDTDIAHRLDRLRTEGGSRAQSARSLAMRWASLAGPAGADSGASLSTGALLALAYPERIAQQAGAPGRYRLANGRAATLEPADALAREPFLAIAEISGTAARGQIRSAARLDRADLDTVAADAITVRTEQAIDTTNGIAVRARSFRTLGALRFEEAAIPLFDRSGAAQLLAEAIAAKGVDRLAWSRDQRILRDRSGFLHRTVGAPWPDLSDAALATTVSAWLAPFIEGKSALGQIDAGDLAPALDLLLPYPLRREMDRLLPSHFDAPSGSRVPIDYGADSGPTLAIRAQELFGLDRHPAIADGRVPLAVVLLSPAHRPIQTTADLPRFWRGNWRDVAKDLRGRYPKHFWPDDPLAAAPTSRAKPRGT